MVGSTSERKSLENSGLTGSSTKSGWYSSSARSTRHDVDLDIRPWKSTTRRRSRVEECRSASEGVGLGAVRLLAQDADDLAATRLDSRP